MSSSTEIDRVAAWLDSTLSGDATLTTLLAAAGDSVMEAPVVQGAAFPVVVYHLHAYRDVRGVGVARVFIDSEWVVQTIVASESYVTARPIADRIDALLQGAVAVAGSGQSAGLTVSAVVRLAPVRYPEVDEGRHYRHLGGRYRIQAHI